MWTDQPVDQAQEHWDYEASFYGRPDSFMARDHQDWHTMARAEGTSPYLCPFDCMAGVDEAAEHEIGVLTYTDANGAHQWTPLYEDQDPAHEARRLAREVGRAVTVKLG